MVLKRIKRSFAFSLNDNKRMLSIDLAKTFSYRVEI